MECEGGALEWMAKAAVMNPLRVSCASRALQTILVLTALHFVKILTRAAATVIVEVSANASALMGFLEHPVTRAHIIGVLLTTVIVLNRRRSALPRATLKAVVAAMDAVWHQGQMEIIVIATVGTRANPVRPVLFFLPAAHGITHTWDRSIAHVPITGAITH